MSASHVGLAHVGYVHYGVCNYNLDPGLIASIQPNQLITVRVQRGRRNRNNGQMNAVHTKWDRIARNNDRMHRTLRSNAFIRNI